MNTAMARDAPASAPAIRLPLLGRLFETLEGSARTCLADLGPVQPGLIDRLAGTRTQMHVLDAPALRATGRPWRRVAPEPRAGADAADIVLCWDLLNYLGPDDLGELADTLGAFARPGGRVHALIQYSAKTMPPRPCAMRIDPALGMRLEETGQAIPAPRYSPKGLEKAMPTLRVDSTMLLNNGMQEFVFELRGN